MGQNNLKPIACPRCKHEGTDYTIEPVGQLANGEPMHFKASCAKCGNYLQYISKNDKYRTKEIDKWVWARTGGRCCYCGDGLNPFERNGYTVEHIIARAKGGTNESENLFPCCKKCNSQKNAKSVEQYREYLMGQHNSPKWVFYFEVMEYSALGDILKKMYF